MKSAVLLLTLLTPSGNDPALDQRVLALSRQLRCLVCQNESLADSQAELASDLRKEIRQQMVQGKNEEEIKAFLTARYGDFVLYRPPLTPRTYLLWFAPFGVAAVGLYAFIRIVRTQRSTTFSGKDHERVETILTNGVGTNIAIYREQMEFLKNEFETGSFTREQFEIERNELEQRLLEECGGPL